MNAAAVVTMGVTFLVVTAVAAYFFWKVLRTSAKSGGNDAK